MQTVKVAHWSLLLVVLATSVVASGCFSRRYPRLMETHLEVLSLYSAKLLALAQDERTVPAQDWGEFTYPLERAREFARLAEARYPDRASLRSFLAVLEAYGALVDDPAVLSAPDSRTVVAARVATFDAAVARTRADLERERAG